MHPAQETPQAKPAPDIQYGTRLHAAYFRQTLRKMNGRTYWHGVYLCFGYYTAPDSTTNEMKDAKKGITALFSIFIGIDSLDYWWNNTASGCISEE